MTIQIRDTNVYVITVAPKQSKLRDVNAYVITQPPPQIELRGFTGYALTENLPTLSLREFSGYALIAPIDRKYFPFKGLDALIKVINKEHDLTLVAANITFGNPTVETDFYDTATVIKPVSTWLYSGEFKLFYNRFALKDGFGADSVPKPAGAFTTVSAWLPAINAQYQLALEARDIVDGPVAANALGFTLTVAPTSFLFKPDTSVFIGTLPTLETEIAVSNLNGFQPAS